MGSADVGEQASEVHRYLSFRLVLLSFPNLDIDHVIFLYTVWLRLIFFSESKTLFPLQHEGSHLKKLLT